MGTSLENVLEDLEELKRHIKYLFECKGSQGDALSFIQSLNELEERLKEVVK